MSDTAAALLISSSSLSQAIGEVVPAEVADVAFISSSESSSAVARLGFSVARGSFTVSSFESQARAVLFQPARALFATTSSLSILATQRQMTLNEDLELLGHCRITARVTSTYRPPTLNRLATQVYVLWGMEVPNASVITYRRDQVLEVINSALQIMYSAARAVDYFARDTTTITFPAAATHLLIDSQMQTLLGPVRYADSKKPLSPVASINDYHHYVDLYAPTAAAPRIYFLDRSYANARDSAAVTLRIAPAPTEATDFELEFARQAPRYNTADLVADTAVPVPHAYVESLLLPIVKHIAASDTLFRREEMRPAIQADYNRARQMLGIVDPEPAPTARNKPRRMEEASV
jgi:hypothetical protein